MSDITYYELLDVPPTADAREIKTAYLRAVRTAHPDVGGSAGLFRAVQGAYETLRDPVSRAEYDATLTGAPAEAESDVADSTVHAPSEPGWGQETEWDGSASTGAGRSVRADDVAEEPLGRLAPWAAGRSGLVSLLVAGVFVLAIYGVFAYVLFERPDLIRPEAATPDLMSWAFVNGPFLRIAVIVYSIALLGFWFGAMMYVAGAHALAVVGFIAWLLAYWDIATTAERWAFGGASVLWVVFNLLLVWMTMMLSAVGQDE